tara:strand:- start:612 stop:746 length:135 start_codon:yes stop_codon:yes gene_type:complete
LIAKEKNTFKKTNEFVGCNPINPKFDVALGNKIKAYYERVERCS